jgi:hypothetical protein
VPEHKIVRTINADAPKGLATQFVTLATAKLMQEILEEIRRRLFVTFQPKQPCDFIVTERVHFQSQFPAHETV